MSENHDELGHGNSVAAWTAVIVAIVGVTLSTIGYLFASSALLTAGGVVTLVSIAVGPVMAKLGFGVSGKAAK